MNAERQFDRKLMGFMNRRGSLAKTIAAALACIAIGAVAALAVCGQVFADGGQTDAQGGIPPGKCAMGWQSRVAGKPSDRDRVLVNGPRDSRGTRAARAAA